MAREYVALFVIVTLHLQQAGSVDDDGLYVGHELMKISVASPPAADTPKIGGASVRVSGLSQSVAYVLITVLVNASTVMIQNSRDYLISVDKGDETSLTLDMDIPCLSPGDYRWWGRLYLVPSPSSQSEDDVCAASCRRGSQRWHAFSKHSAGAPEGIQSICDINSFVAMHERQFHVSTKKSIFPPAHPSALCARIPQRTLIFVAPGPRVDDNPASPRLDQQRVPVAAGKIQADVKTVAGAQVESCDAAQADTADTIRRLQSQVVQLQAAVAERDKTIAELRRSGGARSEGGWEAREGEEGERDGEERGGVNMSRMRQEGGEDQREGGDDGALDGIALHLTYPVADRVYSEVASPIRAMLADAACRVSQVIISTDELVSKNIKTSCVGRRTEPMELFLHVLKAGDQVFQRWSGAHTVGMMAVGLDGRILKTSHFAVFVEPAYIALSSACFTMHPSQAPGGTSISKVSLQWRIRGANLAPGQQSKGKDVGTSGDGNGVEAQGRGGGLQNARGGDGETGDGEETEAYLTAYGDGSVAAVTLFVGGFYAGTTRSSSSADISRFLDENSLWRPVSELLLRAGVQGEGDSGQCSAGGDNTKCGLLVQVRLRARYHDLSASAGTQVRDERWLDLSSPPTCNVTNAVASLPGQQVADTSY